MTTTSSSNRLEERVARAAQAALDERGFVTAIDVLLALGWVVPRRVDEWRHARISCLEEALQVGPDKISTAMRLLEGWAQRHRLSPSEAAYVARTRAEPNFLIAAARPVPAPYQPGSMWRGCVHANTHGTARTESSDAGSDRCTGREPICMRSITSMGVTARKNS